MAFWTQLLIISTGAITIAIPTSGTIDNANTAFGALTKPKIVVINGLSYQESHGWSWNGGTLTVTLDNPVGTGGDIYFIS